MKSKYKHNLFLFVPMMLLLVAVYVKYQQTVKMHVEAAAADEGLLFKPLIMRTLPVDTISIGTCNYNTSTITTTCDISVYTTTGFLCFLECSHNFITKQTNCSLTE